MLAQHEPANEAISMEGISSKPWTIEAWEGIIWSGEAVPQAKIEHLLSLNDLKQHFHRFSSQFRIAMCRLSPFFKGIMTGW